MRLKNPLVIAVLALFVLCFSWHGAYAHSELQAGSVSVVIHIEPGDAPYVGAQSEFTLQFADTANVFSVEKCSCTLKLTDPDGQSEIREISLADATNLMIGKVGFVFTKPGVYSLEIAAKPKSGVLFSEFTLEESVRVEAGPQSYITHPEHEHGKTKEDRSVHNLQRGILAVGALSVLAFATKEHLKAKKLKKKE